jgi:ribose transport system permease protein
VKNNRFFKVIGSTWGQRLTIIVIIMVVMAIFQRSFFTFANLKSILIQISIYGIMACGMLLVVLVGGIDLSLGSMSALASVLVGDFVAKHGTSNGVFFQALAIALGVAVLVGIIHGVFDAVLRLPAFVVTLATQYAMYGIATAYSKGVYIHLTEYEGIYYMLGNSKVLGLAMSIVIFIIFAVITSVALEKTTYGRRIYAVGGNPKAATLVGIKPKAVKISAYVICAITAAIGGIMLASQNLNATYITGKGYEGPVMMVIVVGGISLMGGEGGIGGVLFGALLVGILNNMIILLGISTDYTDFVQGVVIILAVALNVYSSRKSMGLVKPHVSRKKRLAQAAESAEKQ